MAKILVLDDRPVICDAIQTRLSLEGHEVRTACAGDQAIDLGYLFEPELLVCDYDLKGEYDGLEVCEAIHYANNKIKMILMSGYSFSEIEGRLERQRLFSILEKPFCVEKLIEQVDRALENAGSEIPASFSVN